MFAADWLTTFVIFNILRSLLMFFFVYYIRSFDMNMNIIFL